MTTPGWRVVGAVAELDAIDLDGMNPWDYYATWTRVGTVTVQDPLYPWQRDPLTVWEIRTEDGPRRFAAGEVSNGVWLFAVERAE